MSNEVMTYGDPLLDGMLLVINRKLAALGMSHQYTIACRHKATGGYEYSVNTIIGEDVQSTWITEKNRLHVYWYLVGINHGIRLDEKEPK